MNARDRLRRDLGAAMATADPGLSAADRLCVACVDLLRVDGAAISLINSGEPMGTFGSSGELSRRLDELQFTYGEGPCMDAVSSGRPVLAADVGDHREQRWPAFSRAVLDSGVRAVFALPVTVAHTTVGALDLFCNEPGPLSEDRLHGGLWAAELASLPLLDLMTADVDWPTVGEGAGGWEQLASLERVEVYQATGMIIGHLDVDAAEALVRLRAYAFAQGLTASEAAWAIVERRVSLADEESFRSPSDGAGGASA